jgi:hypothetical protein
LPVAAGRVAVGGIGRLVLGRVDDTAGQRRTGRPSSPPARQWYQVERGMASRAQKPRTLT